MINVLVSDQDGSLFGTPTDSFPNNRFLGPNVTTDCTLVNEWNGYKCPGNLFTMLYMHSIAPDYNKRLFSPLDLTDGQWYNRINSHWEWEWDGKEPLNLRKSFFNAIVKTHSEI